MGISGLLPLLKSIQRQRHIRDWAGKTVGIDAYGWLHKGTISCAIDLALGKPTTKYVEYVMHRVNMLRHFGVTPYLVFDGDFLPSKAGTEADRERKRAQSKITGLELLKLGQSTAAYLELQKAIDVTPTMARHIIDACNAIGVACLVAPYEADSQLYYLEKMGIIDAVVSEDSDMLVFGVKCLITKLDQFGECLEVSRDQFTACKEVSLAGWTQQEFRHMCILSGCDYLDRLPSMGLKTAHRMMRKYKQVEKVVRVLQLDGKKSIPKGYLDAFRRADLTFQYQRVFCPMQKRMVMANEPDSDTEMDDEILMYIGPEIETEIAQGVARGELDPMSKEPIRIVKTAPQLNAFQKAWTPSADKRKPEMSNPNQFARAWSGSSSTRIDTPPRNNTTITSFFKPKSEARPVARTPLQMHDMNQISTLGSFSAPARAMSTPSVPQKRTLSTSAGAEKKHPIKPLGSQDNREGGPDSKKLKITPTKAPTMETPITKDTSESAERSSFFSAQSRRPIGTPTPKPRLAKSETDKIKSLPHAAATKPHPVQSRSDKENIAPTPHSIEDNISASPASSACSESTSQTESVRKVTQGWKDLYSFSGPTKGEAKLSAVIEKQRQGAAAAPRMSPLQRLGANSIQNSRRTASRSATAPLFPKSQTDSSESSQSSQDVWPEFVGVGPYSSASTSTSFNSDTAEEEQRKPTLAGPGIFDRFAFGR